MCPSPQKLGEPLAKTRLTSVALSVATLVCVLLAPRPADASVYSFEQLLRLEPPSLLESVAHRWPAAWEVLVQMDLIEPEALQRWDEPRWELPGRATWTMVDGHPVVGTPRLDELWHQLTERQNVRWVRDRYRVSLDDLAKWNADLDLHTLEPGQELMVWRRDPEELSYGIGSPNRGRLRHGEPLPPGDKYVILHPHRAFGTYYMVSELKRVLDAYAEVFPRAEPLMVGDLSFRTGRRIRPHLSHQTGRDVDLTYPRTSPPPNYKRFHYIRRRHLDAERTLWLVREFVNSGMVEYIFMDRWVQRLAYREAERQGAPQEWLEAVFEYPGWGGKAIVRRARGHDDHMHVRFWCQPTDRWCR